MAKKVNPEERIVQYFNTAEYAEAKVVFNIVNGVMKARKAEEEEVAPAPKKTRKKRAKRVAAEGVPEPVAA